jgi:hypothetical protein
VGRSARFRGHGRLGSLLQDYVGVGAGDAEGTHPGAGGSGGVGPGAELPLHRKGEILPGDIGVGRPQVQAGRYRLMFEGEDGFDQAGHPGRPLGVPDVRLHGADDARTLPRPPLSDHRSQGLHLDGVAHRRACAVGLHVLDLARRDAGALVGRFEDGLLARATRRHQQAAGVAVVVYGAAQDNGADGVTVGEGRRQPLEHDHPGALTAYEAVGARVAELAAPVGREHLRRREGYVRFRGEDQVHPPARATVLSPE